MIHVYGLVPAHLLPYGISALNYCCGDDDDDDGDDDDDDDDVGDKTGTHVCFVPESFDRCTARRPNRPRAMHKAKSGHHRCRFRRRILVLPFLTS